MATVKPFNSIKTLIKLTYVTDHIPVEYVMAYFVPESEIMYEVRYLTNGYDVHSGPQVLIRLQSTVEEGRFTYKELDKIDLTTGRKIRRTQGNLADFISRKVFRTQFNGYRPKFFVNLPYEVIEKSKVKKEILQKFKI